MIRESIRLQRQLRRALGLEVARPNPPKPKVEIVQYFDKEEPVHNLIKVPCYLRPAEKKDMQQITDILNYYITEVGHLEEHQPLSIQAVISKWEALREEGLPYIVAVAGDVPKDFKKVTHDKILGFANIGTYADILGRSNGRSRFTGLVEFFTHPKHLRLGIGCALLDRLLCISSTSYIEKCGYEFAMPHPKDHEHHTGAAFGGNPRRFHQLLIDRAFESKDDKDHEWFSYWLKEKFYCFEVARFRSMGRTSGKKERARWLDLCTFQLEVAAPEEFGVFS
jgi:L-amino acid N-acyltransferase YncA